MPRIDRLSLLLAVALPLAPLAVRAQSPGEFLVARIHAKYRGEWIRSVTFVQKSTYGDGRVETWYESAQLPGRLRIDIAPTSNRNSQMMRNDSAYRWINGVRRPPQPLIHPLLFVLYDIHLLPVAESLEKLRRLGVSLDKVHRTQWKGDSVVVLGAALGDTIAKQVWFDATRLVAVRWIDSLPNVRQDIHFGAYAQVGAFWQEREVRIHFNGQLRLLEEYFDVQVDPVLDESVFKPDSVHRTPAWLGAGAARWP